MSILLRPKCRKKLEIFYTRIFGWGVLARFLQHNGRERKIFIAYNLGTKHNAIKVATREWMKNPGEFYL